MPIFTIRPCQASLAVERWPAFLIQPLDLRGDVEETLRPEEESVAGALVRIRGRDCTQVHPSRCAGTGLAPAPAVWLPHMKRTLVSLGLELAVLALMTLAAHGAATNRPVITEFGRDGTLRWQDPATSGTYRVEWTPSLQEKWRMSWDGLKDMPATGDHAVRVPMFYRVVRVEADGAPEEQGRILTLDSSNPTNALSATDRTPGLWATLDGTVYRVSIRLDGPLYMGVGQRRELTAQVVPPIPGTFEWSVTGAKVMLENATSQTVTIIAGPDPSERVGDQVISVKFKPDGRER